MVLMKHINQYCLRSIIPPSCVQPRRKKIVTDQGSLSFDDSRVIISPIFNKGVRFVEGGLLFEEIRCHSAQSQILSCPSFAPSSCMSEG